MDLQDLINDLQKLIFATIHRSHGNLCKVSALVPLITESYGIYKFCISMLRAMYQQLGADEALTVLFDRFESQHFMLRDFYTDCQSIKFLTSLITIPRLPNSSPDLQVDEDGRSIPANAAPESDDRSMSRARSISVEPLASHPHFPLIKSLRNKPVIFLSNNRSKRGSKDNLSCNVNNSFKNSKSNNAYLNSNNESKNVDSWKNNKLFRCNKLSNNKDECRSWSTTCSCLRISTITISSYCNNMTQELNLWRMK